MIENPDAIMILQNNVLFSEAGLVQARKLRNYSQSGTYQLNEEMGNLLVDPLIIEFKAGIIKFDPMSQAGKLGIEPIYVSRAGRRR